MSNMDNYDWNRLDEESLSGRFPQWANGLNEWSAFSRASRVNIFESKGEVEALDGIRVFISHKQEDYKEASRLKRLLNQWGASTWLDVEDPTLFSFPSGPNLSTSKSKARMVAAIVEMALLNCTHVLALMTPRTRRSRWVPYEYGRVKDPAVLSSSAACFIHKVKVDDLPGYAYLCPVLETDSELKEWVRYEQCMYSVTRLEGRLRS